ncbi:MAG: 5-deoxy-glucuronate isomerase [Spirochaetia bacterium]
MKETKAGKKWNSDGSRCITLELFNQKESNLDFLSASEMHIDNAWSSEICYKNEEALVFNLLGPVTVEVEGKDYDLAHYDVLYVPVDTPFRVKHSNPEEEGLLYIYRAVGEKKHPVYHAVWEEVKNNKDRIRYLNRKEVYLMFDVSEDANKFMAGYTFYQDYTRAWPPHNHTDQEEVYSFIEGSGAMEVYGDDENKTFVKGVDVGDHITIPVLNYHPVFSHEDPVTFIWCIAGERYWVGDKNKDFMKGNVDKLTT